MCECVLKGSQVIIADSCHGILDQSHVNKLQTHPDVHAHTQRKSPSSLFSRWCPDLIHFVQRLRQTQASCEFIHSCLCNLPQKEEIMISKLTVKVRTMVEPLGSPGNGHTGEPEGVAPALHLHSLLLPHLMFPLILPDVSDPPLSSLSPSPLLSVRLPL